MKNSNQQIDNYISERYSDLLNYTSYHCELAGIPEQRWMILNNVLYETIEKPEGDLLTLFNNKHSKYNEIDFHILRSIKSKVYINDTSKQPKETTQVFKNAKIGGINGVLNTVIYPKQGKSFLGIYTSHLSSGAHYLILSIENVFELRNYLNEILTGIKE